MEATENKAGIIGSLLIERIENGLEFWDEMYKATLIHAIMCTFKPEVIRNQVILDIVAAPKNDSSDKFLIKWCTRHRPLTDEELEEKYGIKC